MTPQKRPAFQFYPGDWRRDTALQSCSIAARGLWIEMICLMHDCEPYGHMVVGVAPMSASQIARLVGVTPKECAALLSELESAGVFKRTPEGAIYSLRMVRDEDLRNRRAAGGKAGAEHGQRGGEHGLKGGRPRKVEGGFETPLDGNEEPPLKPPPAFAFAFASANNTPPTPQGGRGRKASETFNAVAYLVGHGVEEGTAREYLMIRKTKGKVNTERAIRPTIEAARSAGKSVREVIDICCANSWAQWSGEWSSAKPNGSVTSISAFAGAR